MFAIPTQLRSTALLAFSTLTLLGNAGLCLANPSNENIIVNGDFSQGNTGFTSQLGYVKPEFNCLWGGYYTLAPRFNEPQLHRLIAPEPFASPAKRTSDSKVYFANAGGKEPLVLWSSEVKCQPHTRYTISFYSISLTGYIQDGNPPHQVATKEWVPDFEIWAGKELSAEIQAGCGKYSRGSMVWDSRDATNVTVKIVRTKFPHGGGLIGISDIEMVPVPAGPGSSK